MAEPTWKDLVTLVAALQTRIAQSSTPAGMSAESTTTFTAKKSRVANWLAEVEKKAREECYSPDETSNFVLTVLK